ncbi:hypothetical protein D3C77_34240 [compost metagenome]
MAAKLSVMQELHAELADLLLHELRWYREQEIPVPAADKAAIAKFLKDNSITCDPADKEDIAALRDAFQSQSKARMEAAKAIQMSENDLKEQYGVH